MNEQAPVPPIINPSPVPPLVPGTPPPIGEQPSDRVPVNGIVAAIEAILRQPRRIHFQLTQGRPGLIVAVLLAITLICSLIYGFIVGTFSGGMQLWAAPVKIGGGLLVSGLICLPSLYIFSCLSGSHARLGEIFGLLAGMLAITTILMIGFAPVAWVFSQSTESVPTIGALHLIFWLVATMFGLRFLARGFSQMKAGPRGLLGLWGAIFLMVALQMTTALRPIVAKSDRFFPEKKQSFLNHWEESFEPKHNGSHEPH
jgi:hypothetical protein